MSIGDPLPSFTLPDTGGANHSAPLDDAPPATVVVVTCNHCPYVMAWNPRLKAAAEDYQPRGVRFLAINANDASRYPADSLERMRQFVSDQAWPFPYLHDEAQDVARALGAQATPHIFVLDAGHRLVYRGAPGSEHDNAEWLRAALDATLAGTAPAEAETRPRGCSVKWRA